MLAKQLIVEDCLNDCKERVPQTVVLSDNELIKPERLAQQFLVPFAVKRDIDLVLWKRTGYFLRVKRRALPFAGASARSFLHSASVSLAGSWSFGILAFFLPSVIYGP